MSGYVIIRGHTIPEAWLWAVGGAIGFLLGVHLYPFLLLLIVSEDFPNMAVYGVAVVLAVASLAWIARRADRPAAVRGWAAVTWWLLTGWSNLAFWWVIGDALGALPTLPTNGPLDVLLAGFGIIGSVASLVGSAFLAAATFEVGRRWVARRTPPKAAIIT